jgi:nucleotide-binding universal stress UspA family protein
VSSAPQERPVERILVALDASPQSLATMEVAVELAARLEAELVGIFVEDINLLRLAQLPFAREIGFFSASLRQLDSLDIERQLRAQARWVQSKLARLAERAEVHWTFRVARGVIPAELLAAALDVDLIILGRTGWSGRRGLGSTARIIMTQAPRQALIIQRGVRLGLPVVVVYDGSPPARKALTAAQRVWIPGSLLTVLLLADEAEQAKKLQSEVKEWLQDRGQEAKFYWLTKVDGAILARQVRVEGCGLLVLPAESEKVSRETLVDALNNTECAVLLVR